MSIGIGGSYGMPGALPDDAAEPEQPPEPEMGEQYWATKPGGELITALKDKERRYFAAAERRGIKGMWEVAYAQYYGTDPMNPSDMATQVTQRTGPNGKFIRFRINEVRSIIGQQNIIALGERPAFQCMALNGDYSSMSQVEIADSIVGYLYKKAVGEERERSILESDGVFGAGFGHLRWDFDGGDDVETMQDVPGAPPLPDGSPQQVSVSQRSGAPKVDVCYPWDVIQDPMRTDLDWAIVRERASKWEMAAKFPEHADSITKVDILDEDGVNFMFGHDPDIANSDDCIVRHFYHPVCAAVPNGRWAGICGDELLWDLPCPTKEGIPLVSCTSGRYVCSAFGYAGSWDLIGIQEMLDQMCSDTASNVAAFGRQTMFYEKGSEYSFDKISEGLTAFGVSPGQNPPEFGKPAPMNETVKWFMEYLHERHQSLSGLNSVARGDPKSNIKSGEMAALFHSIAIEFQSARQAALDGYRERLANLMLDMVRQYADSPFLVEVSGKDQRPYLKQFTSQAVSGIRRVEVATTSPMMRSQEGRMQVFQAIGALPPEQRAAAYEFVVTGVSKGFTEKPLSSELRIQWENEQLQDGIPPPVLFTDNPYLHVREHVSALEKLSETFNENPQAVKAFSDHIIQHGVVYQQLDPRIAAFLGIPAPPPIPNSPAANLALEIASAQPVQAVPPGQASADGGNPHAAKGGGPAPAGKPQKVDPTGVKIPNPSKPPANANIQQPEAAE